MKTRPTSPKASLRSPAITRNVAPSVRVSPKSVVTVAFGPPANPLKSRAGIHHAVHWNKIREMVRPYGFEEIEGSAVILGDGQGSVISFSVRGEPKLPEVVQEWLKETEPKGFAEATKIASGAARFLAIIAKAFGVPLLGEIAAGATVVIDGIEKAVKGEG